MFGTPIYSKIVQSAKVKITLTFGRITNIVTAAINGPVLLSCVTVLEVTFSVEGEKIHTDIPKTISV